jgi:hypothetical protein
MPDKKPKCNHEGFYKSAGVFPITSPNSITLMTILYCEKCGTVMCKEIKLGGIVVAQPQIPVGLPINLPNIKKN